MGCFLVSYQYVLHLVYLFSYASVDKENLWLSFLSLLFFQLYPFSPILHLSLSFLIMYKELLSAIPGSSLQMKSGPKNNRE